MTDTDLRRRVLDAIDDARDSPTFTHRRLRAVLALAEITALAHKPVHRQQPGILGGASARCKTCGPSADWPCEWVLAAARVVGIKPKEETP